MSFASPAYLAGLLLVPAAVFVYLALQRRRRAAAAAFSSPALMPNVVTDRPGWRRHVPAALALLALTVLVLAVARPERTVAQPKRQATVMLVTDVSGSMNADDVEPSRLTAAQRAAETFVDKVPKATRVGLVSFNDHAALLLPPTTDREGVGPVVSSLQADGGTAMGDGLAQALASIQAESQRQQPSARGGRPPAAIVLLSDGANSAGSTDPIAAAQAARKLGVPIYAVALGTPDGTITLQDTFGQTRTISVPPDSETLKEIARTTGGRFFDAPDASELKSIYGSLGSRIGVETAKEEVTAAFAGGGLLLLLLGGGLGMRWFGRPL